VLDEGTEFEQVIAPEGGILACSGCHMAVDPNPASADVPENDAEDVGDLQAPEVGPPEALTLGVQDRSDDPDF
jgi:hypothetical protein